MVVTPVTSVSNTMDMASSTYSQSSDAASFCLLPSDCGVLDTFDKYVVIFDLLDPVTARSIMPVLSKATTNHPTFKSTPTTDIWFELSVLCENNTEVELFKIQSSNKVASFGASKIKQVKLSLFTATTNSPSTIQTSELPFCIDRLFVFNEYYMNPKLMVKKLAFRYNLVWTNNIYVTGINDTQSASLATFTREDDCMHQTLFDPSIGPNITRLGLEFWYPGNAQEYGFLTTMAFYQMGVSSDISYFRAWSAYIDENLVSQIKWKTLVSASSDSSNLVYMTA